MESTVVLIICFFGIALIYASVGFGGGSSYIAVLYFAGATMAIIKPSALLCNIVVVSGGTYIFFKEGLIDLKKCWPFLVASVPLAFIGGLWKITESSFFIVLGFSLVVAGILLWIKPINSKTSSDNTIFNFGVGGAVGFLSGMVGIGGGIFLSPILHFRNWDVPKKISALASLFILVNSISGLAGQLSRSADIDWMFILPLLAAVFVGGQIGSRLGAKKFDSLYIKRITALLILIAGGNILWDHL